MKLSKAEKLSLYALALRNVLGTLGVRSHPPAIIWVLTRRCFYECTHCDSWRDETPIDLDALDAVARRIVEAPTKIVALSGGEPLMIKSFPAIVARLKAAGKLISVNTNGHLLEENAGWLAGREVEHVQISIDGHTAERHDAIRRRPGSFDKILRGIAELRARRRGGTPRISVCGTVMKENVDHLTEYVERFEKVADAVELQPLHDSPGLLATAGAQSFAAQDRPAVRRQMERLMQRFGNFDDAFYGSFDRFLFEPQSMRHFATDHCMPMIFNTLTIRDRGACYICRYPLEQNLLAKSISAVWGSEQRWQLYRRLVSGGCSDPCWLRCNIHASGTPGRLLKKTARFW